MKEGLKDGKGGRIIIIHRYICNMNLMYRRKDVVVGGVNCILCMNMHLIYGCAVV